MDNCCISLVKSDGSRCLALTVGNSKFCAEHSALYHSDYLKYKRLEKSVSGIFEDNLSSALPINVLLKAYHRLTLACDLRIKYRQIAIHPSQYDKGHDMRLSFLMEVLEKVYRKIADFFREDGCKKLEVEMDDEIDDEGHVTHEKSVITFEANDMKSKIKSYKKETKIDFEQLTRNLKSKNECEISNFVSTKILKLSNIITELYRETRQLPFLANFTLFLYGIVYFRLFRTMKLETWAYHVVGRAHLVASPIMNFDTITFNQKIESIMSTIISHETYNIRDKSEGDVCEWLLSLPEDVVKYLYDVYSSAERNKTKILCRIYRSGPYSCSLTFLSDISPKILRTVHIPYLNGKYDDNSSFIVMLIIPKREPNIPEFRNFYTSFTKKALIQYNMNLREHSPLTFKDSKPHNKYVVSQVTDRFPKGVVIKEDFNQDIYLQLATTYLGAGNTTESKREEELLKIYT
jgi:hypothetical protein